MAEATTDAFNFDVGQLTRECEGIMAVHARRSRTSRGERTPRPTRTADPELPARLLRDVFQNDKLAEFYAPRGKLGQIAFQTLYLKEYKTTKAEKYRTILGKLKPMDRPTFLAFCTETSTNPETGEFKPPATEPATSDDKARAMFRKLRYAAGTSLLNGVRFDLDEPMEYILAGAGFDWACALRNNTEIEKKSSVAWFTTGGIVRTVDAAVARTYGNIAFANYLYESREKRTSLTPAQQAELFAQLKITVTDLREETITVPTRGSRDIPDVQRNPKVGLLAYMVWVCSTLDRKTMTYFSSPQLLTEKALSLVIVGVRGTHSKAKAKEAYVPKALVEELRSVGKVKPDSLEQVASNALDEEGDVDDDGSAGEPEEPAKPAPPAATSKAKEPVARPGAAAAKADPDDLLARMKAAASGKSAPAVAASQKYYQGVVEGLSPEYSSKGRIATYDGVNFFQVAKGGIVRFV